MIMITDKLGKKVMDIKSREDYLGAAMEIYMRETNRRAIDYSSKKCLAAYRVIATDIENTIDVEARKGNDYIKYTYGNTVMVFRID